MTHKIIDSVYLEKGVQVDICKDGCRRVKGMGWIGKWIEGKMT